MDNDKFTFGRTLGRAVLSIALALYAVPPVEAAERGITRLEGPVDDAMRAKALAAIARGERIVEVASPGGAAETGWQIGDALHAAGVQARCVGVCGSAAAHIVIGSGGCIVARSGHIVLHVALLDPFSPIARALTTTQYATINSSVQKAWVDKAWAHGIPSDLLEWTLQAPNHQYELNAYQMRRVSCTIE